MKLYVTVRRNRAQECIDSMPKEKEPPEEWLKDAASRRLEICGEGGAYYGELSVPESEHRVIAETIGAAFGTAVSFHT